MDNKLVCDVESYVDEVWEDVVADIARLVEVPSIADASAAEAGAPFGRPAVSYTHLDVYKRQS